MNLESAAAVVNAVLYEGYILYPYRPSSPKNRQRWSFGSVFPLAYTEGGGGDPCAMQTECLLRGGPETTVELRVRFLHVINREIGALAEELEALPAAGEAACTLVASLEVDGTRFLAWEEAREREVVLPPTMIGRLLGGVSVPFSFPDSRDVEPIRAGSGRVAGIMIRTEAGVQGQIVARAAAVTDGAYRLTVRVENATHLDAAEAASRDRAQRRAFVSTHTLLGVEGGAFVSMTDPPEELRAAAAACDNQGVWPILLGRPGAADTILSSPIILYDHPEVAPESPGDLFDATEIDEILTLRILTMTEDEKRDMAAVDPRARTLLERSEGLTEQELNRLHGRLRSPRAVSPEHDAGLRVGDQVRLRPKPGGDVFDIVLRDQIAIVEAIERDFENRTHVAVTLRDDPGRDFGIDRMPGHRFFFGLGELERLQP